MTVTSRVAAIALTVLIWAGCSSPMDDVTPAIVLTLSAPTIELAQGSAQLGVVTATVSGGPASAVTITVDPVASNVRGVISSIESRGDGTSALLAFGSDPDAVIGTYHMVVHATAPGLRVATDAIDVSLVPAGTRGYSFEVRPVTVSQGGTATTSISIIRANALGLRVAMTVDSVPHGVDVRIAPAANAQQISTMTVTAMSSVVPGHYTLRLHGLADRLSDRVAMIPLTVVRGP